MSTHKSWFLRDHEQTINLVNSFVEDLSSRVATPPLGPDFIYAPDADTAEKWLCNYRLYKKFQVPDGNSGLADKTVNAMIAYDNSGMKSFLPHCLQMSSSTRAALYRAKLDVGSLIKRFYRFSPAKYAKLPSGETVRSMRGDVSIYAKLSNVKNWTCTSECFDLAATIIYQTCWLKRLAKVHMPRYSSSDNARLAFALDNDGFEIFKCKLLDFVTFVDGSRITTVPKNNSEDRAINCEPMLNMITQTCISGGIRAVLRKGYGIDLDTAQMRHRDMISDLSLSTIDLSKASDSNWLAFIEWFYPPMLVRHLKSARSPCGSYKGVSHTFNMLSPMGNGFTFEIMTLTLLSLARQFCNRSSVFGDDIIISRSVVHQYIDCIQTVGYRINETKSFTEGDFRESCGGFFFRDRYLKSFDFWYSHDICSTIVLVNKLILLRTIFDIEDELRVLLREIPLHMMKSGNYVEGNGTGALDSVIYVPLSLLNVKRFKRKCKSWTRRIPGFIERMSNDIRDYTYDHRVVDFYISYSKVTSDYISEKRWKNVPKSNLRSKAIIGSYLYSGMCSAPIILNKTRIRGDLVVY